MPHVLQMVDSGRLESLRDVMAANEEQLHTEGRQSRRHGADYAVSVWVGLCGPAVCAGKLCRYFSDTEDAYSRSDTQCAVLTHSGILRGCACAGACLPALKISMRRQRHQIMAHSEMLIILSPRAYFLCFACHSELWADIRLSVNVEVVTRSFERAVDCFVRVILDDAKGCQGSTSLLLQRVTVDYPLGCAQAQLVVCASLQICSRPLPT